MLRFLFLEDFPQLFKLQIFQTLRSIYPPKIQLELGKAITFKILLVERKPYFDKSQQRTPVHFQVAQNPDFRPTIPQEMMENTRALPLKSHQSQMEYIEMMKRGWKHQPQERPKFEEIVERFEKMTKEFAPTLSSLHHQL